MSTQTDSRQVKKRQALTRLGTAANATLESILDKTNTEFDSPLRLTASATPDAILNFSSSLVTAADLAKKVVSPVKKQIFSSISSPTINFQTQALSNAADFDITFPASSVGQYRHVGFTLIGSGKIKALFSNEAATEGALSNPGALFVSGGLPIGYVTLQCTNASPAYFKTAGSATNIIENTKIFRFGSGAGGSSSASGTGTGAEVIDLRYRAELQDSFQDIPGDETPVDIGTNKTDATLHDVANELFRINYDASKTVTGTGTSMSLSAAPAYTVKLGDVLVVGNEVREITALGSINSTGAGFTIASAFTTNPAAAAACVSQAIYTKDLNGFTANGTGLAVSSQITDSVSSVLVNYEDSATLGDIIPDWGSTANIAYHVTADNSSWSDRLTRQTSLTGSATAALTPTSSTQLRVRFFSNKTSGSGAVNLLSYKVFWHEEVSNPAGSTYNTAFANLADSQFVNVTHGVVSGKSRFTFSFTYGMALNSGNPSGSALSVFVNGQQAPRYTAGVTSTSQAYFTEISNNVIEMDSDYSTSGLEFIFKVPVTIVDSNTSNTNRLAALETSANQFSGDIQVSPAWLTAVNGTPTATQFRSDITGRKSIVDLSQDLAVQMGNNRLLVQQIMQISTEFGPSNQPVFGVVGDKFDQLRFVGNWSSLVTTNGPQAQITSGNVPLNSYIEVVFWGTGLNLLMAQIGSSNDARVSIDGAAEGANIFPAATSTILGARNYATNTVVTVASGLSAGLHTARIRWNTSGASADVQGVEILTETTSLRVKPGTVLKGKQVNTLAVLSTPAYNTTFETGTLGTRGGSVVTYIKSDGTVGKVVNPTNASSAFAASADHTNEEIIRSYHFREFGANRADDFSTLVNSSSTRAFTLDDGITTLVGSGVQVANITTGDYLFAATTNNFMTFTFVGTGLDLRLIGIGAGTYDNHTIAVDGVNVTTTAIGTQFDSVLKIASGLPFGTHTVRITRTATAASGIAVRDFIVYGPKRPTVPAGAIEIGQYFIAADYSAIAAYSLEGISTGVTRKFALRENLLVGTWAIPAVQAANLGGFYVNSTTASSYVEHTFYGTGVNLRFASSVAAAAFTVSIDGSTNLSGFTTSLVQGGTGLSFTAGTGVVTGTSSVSVGGNSLNISGLTLGKHVIRVAYTSGAATFVETFDEINPIYSVGFNKPNALQSTYSVGNMSISDLRRWNSRDVVTDTKTNISQAFGLQAGGTTTATSPVPMPDMSVAHYSETGRIKISYSIVVSNTSAGGFTGCYVFLNGKLFNTKGNNHATTFIQTIADSFVLEAPKGFNKVDIYWAVNGGNTGGLQQNWRNITVEDV